MLHMDEHENFKPIRVDHPKDVEKIAYLLDFDSCGRIGRKQNRRT